MAVLYSIRFWIGTKDSFSQHFLMWSCDLVGRYYKLRRKHGFVTLALSWYSCALQFSASFPAKRPKLKSPSLVLSFIKFWLVWGESIVYQVSCNLQMVPQVALGKGECTPCRGHTKLMTARSDLDYKWKWLRKGLTPSLSWWKIILISEIEY